MYVSLVILTPKKKTIIHLEQNFSDFKIQLARKIRTDVLSLYRKISSLGAPDRSKKSLPIEWNAIHITNFIKSLSLRRS